MNMRLRPKLIALFLLSSLLPLVLTGWMTARWLSDMANETARTRASTILEIKKNRLEQYFARYRTDMETLTNGTQTLLSQQVQKLETVRDLYGQTVQHQFQEWTRETEAFAATEQLAKNLLSIDWVFRDGGEKITGERWPVLAATMTPSLNRFREKQGFDNVYLISAQGNVVLSGTPDPLLGKNLGKSPLKESSLGKLFTAALTKSNFQGFAPATYLDNGMTAWIGTPIHRDGNPDGRVIGVLAARFAPALLARITIPLGEADKNIHLYLVEPTHPTGTETGPAKTESTAATSAGSANFAHDKGVGARKGMDGQPMFSAWAPLSIAPWAGPSDPPWTIVAEQSLAQIFLTDAKQAIPFYKKQMDQSGYYDFFLIQPDGDIFFSATRQADFGTNLIHGPYAETNLGKLVRQVLAKPAFGLTDFAPYPPSNNEPAAFMAQPLLQDGALKLVVALQLPLETLTTLMQHRDGLESDGDAYLVGPDQRMRTDSIRDPQNHSVLASFANKGTDNTIHSEAVQAALAGKSDLLIGKNWSGKPVFTAFAPVQPGNDATWALVTETPILQGILPLHLLPAPVWLAALVSLLGCAGIGWMTANGLRQTLFRCVEPLQGMHGGQVSPSTMSRRTDEFGLVAREIQSIAERWQQVAQRLRTSGSQVVVMGSELSGLVQRAIADHSRDRTLVDWETGESATQEIAARIQQHLKQIQAMEQLLGRIDHTVLQGKNTLEQATTSAKAIADQTALFAETAQQINQLSMKAAFEVTTAGSEGKGVKRTGTVVMEIRKLAERGRIFADEIGELSLGMTYTVENARAILGSVASALQESAALMQGMVLADSAQHGQMVHIHGMTQELKGRIQSHATVLHQLTPVAEALAQQVSLLQGDLAFFNRGKGTPQSAAVSEAEMLAEGAMES
ncbi:MAG: methyl-accepting chemotaxis protein [Magnetococcales bacterium]|nr:methyl-accepting chemotaxis protein [Magnetococcales bacterium]